VKALIYGGSGALAGAIASAFRGVGWAVDTLERGGAGFAPVNKAYSEFRPSELHDAYVLPQALFLKKPLAESSEDEIEAVFSVGLVEIAKCLANALAVPAPADRRVDYALIGSTSAYAGFADTALYCAAKHGLVGLVRALNEEYANTGRRFWLFSMGTMDTPMGRQLVDQDPASFLPPTEVADRIVGAITSPSNLFEPEVVIRRRTIRFLGDDK
jgi:NAD(P)-dependent dehydrogenase (short-subunit alcohol dehydrogenase family)